MYVQMPQQSVINCNTDTLHWSGFMHVAVLTSGLFCSYSKPLEAVELMAKLKHLFDPNAILNPYKFLPQQEREHNEELRRASV